MPQKNSYAFEPPMDYLVGEGVGSSFDKKDLKRLQDSEKLNTDVKDKIYFAIDIIIQNVKAKKALASKCSACSKIKSLIVQFQKI